MKKVLVIRLCQNLAMFPDCFVIILRASGSVSLRHIMPYLIARLQIEQQDIGKIISDRLRLDITF